VEDVLVEDVLDVGEDVLVEDVLDVVIGELGLYPKYVSTPPTATRKTKIKRTTKPALAKVLMQVAWPRREGSRPHPAVCSKRELHPDACILTYLF
jgi:hypothetical protein